MNGHGQRQAFRAEPRAEAPERLSGRRAAMEQLLRWADHLAPAERSLVRCAYDWGISSREISLLTGQTAPVIRRRLRQLLRRINAPTFQTVIRLMNVLPESRRAIARSVVLQGVSQRQTAKSLGVSIHHVRREILAIEAICELAGDRMTARSAIG